MMRDAFLSVLLMAKAASAADYCGLDADQLRGLPIRLAGYWSATVRDQVVGIGDGQVHRLART